MFESNDLLSHGSFLKAAVYLTASLLLGLLGVRLGIYTAGR